MAEDMGTAQPFGAQGAQETVNRGWAEGAQLGREALRKGQFPVTRKGLEKVGDNRGQPFGADAVRRLPDPSQGLSDRCATGLGPANPSLHRRWLAGQQTDG